MAKAVKEKFGKPCISMGNVRDPKVAERILADGDADLIGMGRGLIADPAWVNKVVSVFTPHIFSPNTATVGTYCNTLSIPSP